MLVVQELESSLFGDTMSGLSPAELLTDDGSFTAATTAEPCVPDRDE